MVAVWWLVYSCTEILLSVFMTGGVGGVGGMVKCLCTCRGRVVSRFMHFAVRGGGGLCLSVPGFEKADFRVLEV